MPNKALSAVLGLGGQAGRSGGSCPPTIAQPTLQEQGESQTVPWGLGTRWAGARPGGLLARGVPKEGLGGVGEGADSSSCYGPGPAP